MVSRLLERYTQGFVVVVILFALFGWFVPGLFSLLVPHIKLGLGIIMFAMGMTLEPRDFSRVAKMPRAIGVGISAQFVVMPLAALALTQIVELNSELALGFIILGACPGGTASNVVAYLARADVALSVTMTAISTLLAVVLTPLWTQALGASYLPVDGRAMLITIAQIVFAPVISGFLIRLWLKNRVAPALAVFPAISVTLIGLIVAAVVAVQRDAVATSGALVIVLAIVHNTIGLSLGYGLAWGARLPVAARRTIAIEVGMQNSGLGMALASQHFAGTAASVPSAVFSVLHNISGSALASWWRSRTELDTINE